jgi:hypothetical protein
MPTDAALIPPELAEILDRVRYAADRMPDRQLEVRCLFAILLLPVASGDPLPQRQDVMSYELGHDWRSRVKEFDPVPIAAASIGQVHRGAYLTILWPCTRAHDGRATDCGN